MVLCITPNPAIDRTLIVPNLALGSVHRSEQTIVAAGGKGLNVARTIRTLGGDPLCMGFAGGHAGQLLADLAQQEGLRSSWTWLNHETRTCTILVSESGDATVINERGMPVSKAAWKRFRQDISEHFSSVGLVCISGSFPPQSSAEDFQDLLSLLVRSGKQVWLDTSGTALDIATTFPGIGIKVNGAEIGESLGIDVQDAESAKKVPPILLERGLTACVITLGSEGALLATNEGAWHAQGPQVDVISTVGSGDAFFGGLARALDIGKDWPAALRDAVAAGTANVLTAGGGRFAIQDFKEIREQVQIRAW